MCFINAESLTLKKLEEKYPWMLCELCVSHGLDLLLEYMAGSKTKTSVLATVVAMVSLYMHIYMHLYASACILQIPRLAQAGVPVPRQATHLVWAHVSLSHPKSPCVTLGPCEFSSAVCTSKCTGLSWRGTPHIPTHA